MTGINRGKETAEEKTERILKLLAAGNTREEVGKYYEQPWKTIDMHMRRQGYRWDKENQTYVKKEAEQPLTADTLTLLDHTKAGYIARQFQTKYPDARQIAQKQGFESIEELGKYMESEGYFWNDEISRYELKSPMIEEVDKESVGVTNNVAQSKGISTIGDILLNEKEMLDFLLKHQGQLQQLLTPKTAGDLPSIRFKGKASNKTFTLADVLQVLIDDYKAQYNVTHRVIIEVALQDFFEKYGFAHRIEAVKY